MFSDRDEENPGATSPSNKNDQMLESKKINPMTVQRFYERHVANAVEVKFVNNRYTTPITIEFGSRSYRKYRFQMP